MGSVSTRSLFSQILSVISRRDFERHVRDLQAERAAKGFSCWDQFVAMLLRYLAFKSHLKWALSNLVALLRWNLFSYRNLLGVDQQPL